MFSLVLPIKVISEGLYATLEVPSEARVRLLGLARGSSKSSGELSRSASASFSFGSCFGGLPLFCLIRSSKTKLGRITARIGGKKQRVNYYLEGERVRNETYGTTSGCFGGWSWIFHDLMLLLATHTATSNSRRGMEIGKRGF